MTKAQEEYYRTDHWINLRQKAKEVFIYGCILTKSHIYVLHHLNYLNMGKEKFWLDILPLSPEIHEDFHKWVSLNKCGFHQLLDYAINKKIDLTPGAFKILKKAQSHNNWLRNENRKNPKTTLKVTKVKAKERDGGFPVKKKGKAFARKVYLLCQRKRVGQTISRSQVAELGNALFLSAFDKKFSRIEVDLAQFKFFAETYFGIK